MMMKNILKKVLPHSLRERIRATLAEEEIPALRGDLDLAFSVGNDHLFLDGWLAGPGGLITAVHVLDEAGNSTEVPFTVYQYARADVIDALKGTAPANHCVAYRMLIQYPLGKTRPDAVLLRMNNGASFRQRIEDCYTDTLRRAWKVDKLRITPERYGFTQPLAENPVYNRLIVAPSQAYLEKQTAFEGHVDGWYKDKDGSMIIFGWIDDDSHVRGAGHLSHAKTNQELPPTEMFRYYRADLESKPHEPLGMLLFADAPGGRAPQRVRFHTQSQGEVFLSLKDNDHNTNGRPLLEIFLSIYEGCRRAGLSESDQQRLSTRFIPMIGSLYSELQGDVFIAEDVQFGVPIPNPEVSLVIPIYKSYELTRQQMADFSIDPFITRQDIILVLDSPDDSTRFKLWMHRLYDLYQIPVRVLIMNKNGGFGRACNAGASAAHAPHVLFLNSDVFPKRPGWLESMLSRLHEDASVGVVGARLLFPDESIQHVGITWRRDAALDHQLINHLPWKGMDPSLVPHRGAVEVPAVSAACLLCRAEEFRSLGRFDVGYIRGDYEDTDFCLKVRERGKRVVCDHAAVLYHMEGNSYPSQERRKAFFFNAMRHELRWGALIARLTNGNPAGEVT